MSDLWKMGQIAIKLEALGAKHAPVQCFTEPPRTEYGREVTLRDPPGVYYLLGTDNRDRRDYADEVQLIFLGVPRDVGRYAVAIGYAVVNSESLPSDNGPVPSAILWPL